MSYATKKNFNIAHLFVLSLLTLLWPNVAHAYIDPGTGNALIYIFVSAFGVVGYFFKSLYYKLIGRKGDLNSNVDHSIVIFSEGKRYSQTFVPIVKELQSRNHPFTYLTCDIEDPVLAFEDDLIHSKYIGEGSAAFARLAAYRGEVLLATTPNIGNENFPIPRPKYFKKLAHVLHGVGSVATYFKNSLDCYDVVFLSGPFMEKEIRNLERKRNLKPKECVPAGLPYFDELTDEFQKRSNQEDSRQESKKQPPKSTVLIAPSWGAKSLLNVCGLDFIKNLALENVNIIVRPHPQSWKTELELIEKLKEEARRLPNIVIDREVSPASSMNAADVLISEKSGVRFDFAFIHKKPVISIDIPADSLQPYEWSDLESVWDEEAQFRVGPVLRVSEIDRLPSALVEALSMKPHQLEQFKSESLYFEGNSVNKIVDWLIENSERST